MKKKLLISAMVILAIPLFLYTIGAIVFCVIFPANGYSINTTAGTNSMYPVLIGKSLIIKNLNVPFENLKVGDIITYREPVSFSFSHSHYRSPWGKPGEPEPTPTPVPTPTPTPFYKDEGIEYKPSDSIAHRIIEVIDGQGDRALICKGDNNPKADPYPVMKSGYISKVIWFSNGLGPVFNAVYEGPLMLVPLAVFAVLGVCLVRMMTKEEKEKQKATEKK